ncbi:unnamed protein product [Rotaria sordida]|uniref:Uncharacterized protein n=1 Tax=Rotaria sordida TaxID=392033 RepID=A0A814ZFR4_9BILA|nr:unnamed protein product [Rotaria sordida]CAF1130530.1 unnamed protein product [Rotaria sordida]CAF1136048.1 unnamed protein product [Rotaria sordida]CAF1242486.1 unnamed protein product [Rotaria sordida]CAF1269668.1 unnamed protein product [Rotaria sordida]
MNKQVVYLILIFIIIENVFNIEIENNRYRRETLWKTTEVLSCVRRLRSFIIRPSKVDPSKKILDCLLQKKADKLKKKIG